MAASFDWEKSQSPEYLTQIYKSFMQKGLALHNAIQSPTWLTPSTYLDPEQLANNGWILATANTVGCEYEWPEDRDEDRTVEAERRMRLPRLYKHLIHGKTVEHIFAP
jgi:hypothetical protein